MQLTSCEIHVFRAIVTVLLSIRLHEESILEAERVGELVRSLGLEHHIVTLNWRDGWGRGLPPRCEVVTENRYRSMLWYCQKKSIRTLMMAHNLNEQIGELHKTEKVIHRLYAYRQVS